VQGAEPLSVALSGPADDALGRLLNREDQVTDLIAFLAALDPKPLATALGLEAQDVRTVREQKITARVDGVSLSGRADLLVYEGAQLCALVEVKASAGEHGGQFRLYQAWAAAQDLPVSACHLIALAGETPGVPIGWTTSLTIPGLLRNWEASNHGQAKWLAHSAAQVLAARADQFNGPLGKVTHPVVADLVAKQLVVDLSRSRSGRPALKDLHVHPRARTAGGAANVLAWVPLPGHEDDCDQALCLDLRVGRRNRPADPWQLRIGVEVDAAYGLTVRQARARAHDLAVLARPHLTRSALQVALQHAGHEKLAASLTAGRGPNYDGMRRDASQDELDAWRNSAARGDVPGIHPLMYSDWGRRLATQTLVDVTSIDRQGLKTLLTVALEHLAATAQELTKGLQTGAGSQPPLREESST
jgi:hypothetical protein